MEATPPCSARAAGVAVAAGPAAATVPPPPRDDCGCHNEPTGTYWHAKRDASSPSCFLSPHPVTFQQQQQPSDVPVSPPHPGHLSEDSMELSLLTRLVRTKPVWFLPNTQRSAAIHYLQGQPVGVRHGIFILVLPMKKT